MLVRFKSIGMIVLRAHINLFKWVCRWFPGLKRLALKVFDYLPWLESKLMQPGVYYTGTPMKLPLPERAILANYIEMYHTGGRPNQLLIDLSVMVAGDNKTGIQRVVRSLLFEFIKDPVSCYRVEFVYAMPARRGFYYARQFTAALLDGDLSAVQDAPVEVSAGDKFIGLDFSPFIIPAQFDFLKQIQAQGVKVYFVVYDLLPLLLPQSFDIRMRVKFLAWLKTVTQFDGAICISAAVAAELRAWLGQVPDAFDIQWMHLGADLENSIASYGLPTSAAQVCEAIRHEVSFLMVGTVEPRKNHEQVLSAFELLWEQGVNVQLVIVGKEGWMMNKFIRKIRHHPELLKRLYWLEEMSDEYLQQVYDASSCLIAASQGEGFGLPLIEAAKNHLPIIARDIPVFREVAQEHAFYFKGESAQDLACCIQSWLALYQEEKHPPSVNMPWLTWKESAEKLKQVLSL